MLATKRRSDALDRNNMEEYEMPDFSGSYSAQVGSQNTISAPPDRVINVVIASAIQKTADDNWSGSRLTIWGVADIADGNGTARGYFRNEHSNGDIDYGTTESTVTTKGTEVTMTGTWRFTGGTGKFVKITGNGTFTDTQTSPMASEGAWRGSYSLG
jgi:hypothetical protein